MKGLVCMEHRLFVYGTLRRGERNHGLLGSSRCEAFLARAPGVLVDTGLGFPAMKETGASSGETPGMVCGEIYRVDEATLARIDILEDCVRILLIHSTRYFKAKYIHRFD